MSLYPSLEDMKVHQIMQAQAETFQAPSAPVAYEAAAPSPALSQSELATVYPSLAEEYMGLRLEPPTQPLPAYPTPPSSVASAPSGQVALRASEGALALPGGRPSATAGMVAPLSGGNLGLERAGSLIHGVRQVVLCKDAKGLVGLRLRSIDKGVFVQMVAAGSPGALGGLRFGDQILQIDGKDVAGLSGEKAMDLLKKASPQRLVLAVRDRPFERTVTLHKDSGGHVGFTYRGNKITAIAVGTSAARNGLLIDHAFLEINGQNVVELKDKEIGAIFDKAGQIVTLTIMPWYIYEHMLSKMASGLVKKVMDHSIPVV